MANKRNSKDKVVVSGRVLLETIPGTGPVPACFALNPLFTSVGTGTVSVVGGSKLAAISDVYQYFRFTSVKLRFLGAHSAPTVDYPQYMGYWPDSPDVPPLTGPVVIDAPWTYPCINSLATGDTVPSSPPVVAVPKKMLLTQNLLWWKTRIGVSPTQFEDQGLFATGDAGMTSFWDLQYTVELKGFTAINETPSRVRYIAQTPWSDLSEEDTEETKAGMRPKADHESVVPSGDSRASSSKTPSTTGSALIRTLPRRASTVKPSGTVT